MNNYLILNDHDNVMVALKNFNKGDIVNGITLLDDIPQGHKIALSEICQNSNVIKYGFPIGHATKTIQKGTHVHTHNLKTNLSGELKYEYKKTDYIPSSFNYKDLKVNVYKRENGLYGIRNYIYIVPLVGCINNQAKIIKDELLKESNFDKCDGIIVLNHPYGCSQLNEDLLTTQLILSNLVKNPNCGGALLLSLGCENNTLESFKKVLGNVDESRIKFLVCQKSDNEIEDGKKLVKDIYNTIKNDERTLTPISVINIGLKCGGSDGLSGITANPLVGKISDILVDNGGSTVLSEVPEMFGAETILMNRCKNKETFDKTVNLINNFKDYFIKHNQVVYENPSPGNKEGGITTLEDKSLGCTQKAGTSLVQDVLDYGDTVKIKGLNLLNGPGNDMVACTNLAAAGCHLILFTTGRGTPFGTVIPTIKISTNSSLYNKKKSWIDFNAGSLIEGISMESLTNDFLKYIIDVINGKKSKNEENSFQEIAIFKDGVTL